MATKCALDAMNSIQEKRHDELYTELQDLEKQTSMLATDLKELKDGYKHLEADLAEVKKDVESKADNAFVSELERRIIDLQNRSRRNNLVFWNVPEGSEKDGTMVEFIKNLLQEQMELDGAEDIEIMRAHRTPSAIRKDASKPRPIHVYLLRYSYRQYILANVTKCLKDNQYKGSSLYISDNVTKEVREQRKILKEKYLDDLRKRDDVAFTYVAWSVPPKIIYKVKDEQFTKVIQ